MLTYKKLSKKERSLKGFTGLTIKEFAELRDTLLPLWRGRFERSGRKRRVGGGKKSRLSFEDELVLILFFYRNYVIYEILGYLFNLDIANISRHIETLERTLAILAQNKLKKPKGIKKITSMQALLEKFPELEELIADATEQAIERPQKNATQKKHYSGKKKRHTIKTQVVITKKKRIYDVSKSYPGHVHDKTIMVKERTPQKIPESSRVRLDNAYHKIQKEYPLPIFILPEKANRWHKLSRKQKQGNKAKAKERIGVEHLFSRLKSFGVLDQKYRHAVSKHNRTFKNICGLWNFRLDLGTVS